MSPAPHQVPNSSPADRAGERRLRKRGGPDRRALRRRRALEALEPRTLLATIPAAVTTAQNNLSGAVNRETSNESSPSIAVSQADPRQLSAVWTRLDPGNLGLTPVVNIQTTVQGAFSNNGGQTWGSFTAAPERYSDPTTSNPIQLFTDITDASTAFDRSGHMYVLVSQHNAGNTAGVLVLFKYNVSGGSPVLMDLNPAPGRVGKVVYEWDPTLTNNSPSPGTYQAWDPVLAVDEGVAAFTDPENPAFNQDDVFSGNVYVAWTGFDPQINAAVAPRANALVVAASSDGGATFKSPVTVDDGGGVRTPRLSISQGRPAQTQTENPPGFQNLATIPAGTVSFTWDDYFSGRNATPPVSLIKNDHANAALVEQFSQQYTALTGAIIDAVDPGSGNPHQEQTTTFNLPVNFADGRFTTIDRLDVDLSVNHSAINELRIVLVAPDGTRVLLLDNQTDNAGQARAGVGATGSGLGFPRSFQGSLDTVFSDQAATSIVGNGGGAASLGYFRPESWSPFSPALGVFAGRSTAQLTGTWKLEITDFRATTGTPLPPRNLVSFGLKFSAGMRGGVITPVTNPAHWTAPDLGDLTVASTTIRGEDPGTAIPTQSDVDPRGILPAPVIATDSTLGAFSPHQGLTYIAYVDRINLIRDGAVATGNPDDNTDIRLRTVELVQTPLGPRWLVMGGNNKVNDDAGLIDGATQAIIAPGIPLTTGRPQYQPQVAVDPATGTMVLTWLDARDDASARRVANYLTTSIDGGVTFADQTFVNQPMAPFDGTIRRDVVLGPLPENQSPGNGNREATYGFGFRQGLAVLGGRVYPAWSGNNNGGVDGLQRLDIIAGLTEIAGGPRIVSSTMGLIRAQQVVRLSDGARLSFNDQTDPDTGIPIADGFVVTFDRPVDPNSFGTDDVRVYYRAPDVPGTSPGVQPPVLDVIPLDSSNGDDPLVAAFERQFGATRFLVRFAASPFVGTYSYTVGPAINDRIRNAVATREFAAARTPANLPRIPAVGTGNSGNPANDTVTSTVSVNVPANEVLQDLNVNLSIRHTNVGDLRIRLLPPPALAALGVQPVVLVQNRPFLAVGSGGDFRDLTLDDQSTNALALLAQFGPPYTGEFRPEQTLNQAALVGRNPSGTWTLEITDAKGSDVGVLFGWSLLITTRTTDAAPALVGNRMDQNADAVEGRTPATTPLVDYVPGDVYAVPRPDTRRPDRPDQLNLFGFNTNPNVQPYAVDPLDFGPPYIETDLPLYVPGPHLVNSSTYDASADPTQVNRVVPDGTLNPDLTTTPGVNTSTIHVGGDANLQVTDLKVMVDVSYTRPQDLRIFLIAPDGTSIPLVQNIQPAGSSRGFDHTIFDDAAPRSVAAAGGSFVGSYTPDTALVSLAGKTLKGDWTLRVEDTFDDSTLGGPPPARALIRGWSLTAQATPVFLDQAADRLTIRFDRDMNPDSITQGNHVVELVGPDGRPIPGPFTIVATPNLDPLYPDPDPAHPRTYQIVLPPPPSPILLDANGDPVIDPATSLPKPNPAYYAPNASRSGSYTVRLASDVRSEQELELDSNLNAGLDNLRGTPSQGTSPITRSFVFNPSSGLPTANDGTITPGVTEEAQITFNESFLVQDVVVQLNITYPDDTQLEASLIAPNGQEVLLFSGLKTPGANFNDTIFDDRAPTPITNGGPPYSGRFAPQVGGGISLGNLVGVANAQGTWKLRVTVLGGGASGRINSWRLTLAQPLSNTGLGEPVADRADVNFRVFTMDPTDPLASSTWTPVGPTGAGARGQNLNAQVAGRINQVVFDPSDRSRNTAFAAVPGGGVWKTTNFLTADPTGPIWLPLLDDAPTLGMNVGQIAVFARNGDPGQTVVFASTGDADATGDSLLSGSTSTARGIGFLRSFDGGKTWELLDSLDNSGAFAGRNHEFASIPGQAGTTTFRLIVDPNPVQTDPTRIILYAAVSDIDGQGRAVTGGPLGGIYRSTDSGTTWTRVRAGQATDVVFDPNSQAPDLVSGGITRPGNLQFLYASFRGDGVYFSPNQGDVWNGVLGTTGDPLIQNVGPQPLPVPVQNPSVPPTPNSPTLPLGQVANGGRIVLAKPAPTGNALQDGIYRGWLYAALVQNIDVQAAPTSDFIGLYLTKDFGQNWTKIDIPAFQGFLPSNTTSNGNVDYTITGSGTILGSPFHLGNFDLSLAVDPNNPNVVYLGGTDEFQNSGLVRVNVTALHDPHAFYLDSLGDNGGQLASPSTAGSGVTVVNPLAAVGPFYDPRTTPFINLIRDPLNPFVAGATVLVENTAAFLNDGGASRWIPYDRALAPDPFASPLTAWGTPTRGVHGITALRDPLTGQSRLVFATDQGVYSVVADRDGQFVGSIGGFDLLSHPFGDQPVVNGSRNGNLQTAQFYAGAAQPSQLAADLAQLAGFFYGSSENVGTIWSDPDVLNPGATGYGNVSWTGLFDRGPSRGDVATQQELNVDLIPDPNNPGQFLTVVRDGGAAYNWRSSEGLLSVDGRPSTDTWQVNAIARTFNLYQTSGGGDTPDVQWPLRGGFVFAVNPINGDQSVIGSQAGRIFATKDRGLVWAEIGNPGSFNNSRATALAYGAPDPGVQDVLKLDDYVLVGTAAGGIFVTYTGGGTGGGQGNAWINISNGLDNSPVRKIIADPSRGSFRAYAVTEKGVYYTPDTRNVAANGWANITNGLFGVTQRPFGGSGAGQSQLMQILTSLAVDWRYVVPNAFPTDLGAAVPLNQTHPALYVGGDAGVFRSLDNGATWARFPDSNVSDAGVVGPFASSLLNSPAGLGGGLPNAIVTDLDLSLGNIDPTTGRPNSLAPNDSSPLKDSRGPNVLTAATFGRGSFAIRLAPIVFDASATGGARVLGIDETTDSGLFNDDGVTNVTDPLVVGYSEQTAFGNYVRITLWDLTDPTDPKIIGGYDPSKPATDVAANWTRPDGTFAIRVNPDVYKADGSTDGRKTIGVQATNISGTQGNMGIFQFTLDTIKPEPAGLPDLLASNDTGVKLDGTPNDADEITNPVRGAGNGSLTFNVGFAADPTGANTQAALFRGATQVGAKILGLTSANLTDPAPITPDNTYAYSVRLTDLAGNVSDVDPSHVLNVRVDTTNPAKPSRPQLDAASNSGDPTDLITNVRRPVFTNLGEPNTQANPNNPGVTQRNQVLLIDQAGNTVGIGEVQSSGRYSVAPGTDLANGVYTFQVQVRDVAGNLSILSDPITITVQNVSLTTPTLKLVSEDDSGVIGDNITKVQTPRLEGTGDPNLTVRIIDVLGNVPVPNLPHGPGDPIPYPVLADITGGQTIRTSDVGKYLAQFLQALPEGTYRLVARVSDVAGNTADSPELRLTIAVTGTGKKPTLTLAPAFDTGTKGDGVTSSRVVALLGSGVKPDGNQPPPSVALFRAGAAATPANELDRVVADANGNFTLRPPKQLLNGTITLVARTIDVAGNYGPASDPFVLRITTTEGDFNNDGRADLGSYSRNYSNGQFSIGFSGGTGFLDTTFAPSRGLTGDRMVPIEGDFDGDGITDYGVFDDRTATWYIHQSTFGVLVRQLGSPGVSVPVPADYDGDGRTDLVVFHPTSAKWVGWLSGGGTTSWAGVSSGQGVINNIQFGWGTDFGGQDQPVVADYDGDGKADLMLYRPQTAEWLGWLSGGGALAPFQFGWPGVDRAAPADYTGDGKTDLGLYRPTDGTWLYKPMVINAGGQPAPFGGVQFRPGFAAAGDIPAPLDYDNDGKADFTVFRPSTTAWLSTASIINGRLFGPPDTLPLAAPLFPYRLPIRGGTTGGGTVTALSFSAGGPAGSDSAAPVVAPPPADPANGLGSAPSLAAAPGQAPASGLDNGNGAGLTNTPAVNAPIGRYAAALARRRQQLGRLAARQRPANPAAGLARPGASVAQANRPNAALALILGLRRGRLG